MTQIELAKQVGISINSIRRYESGERMPSLEVVEAISNALGVRDLSEIIELPEGVQKKIIALENETRSENGNASAVKNAELLSEANITAKMLRAFDNLSIKGKEKAVEFAEILCGSPDYRYKHEH